MPLAAWIASQPDQTSIEKTLKIAAARKKKRKPSLKTISPCVDLLSVVTMYELTPSM